MKIDMFEMDKTALMVIDVQGRLAQMMHRKKFLIEQIQIMIHAAKLLDLPIFWLEQYPQGLGETVDEIKQLMQDIKPYEKISFSSCGQQQLLTDLRSSGRSQLIVTGIESHVCVYQTVLDLLDGQFQVAVNQDAVSSRTKANKNLGMARMQQAGATITSTEMVLFELMRTAEHPSFKQISKLLK
ncbi:hydrolase [Marinicella litoralis]|uniref:Nicotinamidase-related amidase n=1 Tax=Marinicella litoralis TaxID=644220 RepID=A0A4R6XLG5_9GAMM|nr:hydrolase [Marinicella litoralis]TDR20406.1 nicotinamidase-related amidase [Marinicella litoralis]